MTTASSTTPAIAEVPRLADWSGLCASEDLLHQILESSSECIKLLDLSGTLLFMNSAGQRLMDLDCQSGLLGTNWLACWHGPDLAGATAAVAAARAGGTGRFTGFCPSATGTPRWWDVVLTPIPKNGPPNKLLAISREVTERRQAEEKIRSQLDELLAWQHGMIHREDRVRQLKAEVNALLARLGLPPRYSSQNEAS
jgi:PAS domain S-box-containing protein